MRNFIFPFWRGNSQGNENNIIIFTLFFKDVKHILVLVFVIRETTILYVLNIIFLLEILKLN